MAIALPAARLLSDEVSEALRLRALRGCETGLTEADVAALLGVSRETVCRWWSAYARGGTDALPQPRTGRPLGSGRLLSDARAQRIQGRLGHHNPEELGVPAPLGNRRAVRDLIGREFDIRLAARTVGAYLRRWGSTPQRPRRHHRHQDPEEVRQWLEETDPALARRAAREGAPILWGAEVGVAADGFPGRGYARVGQAATAAVPGPHTRVNPIAAVSAGGPARFMTDRGARGGALFVEFVRRRLRSTAGEVFLIVDRLRAHEDGPVAEGLGRHRDCIEVFSLPRRAPGLNPEEYLPNDLKGQVKSEGLPETKGDLRSRMQRFMHRLVHLPGHVMSYFQHPCVQYAADNT